MRAVVPLPAQMDVIYQVDLGVRHHIRYLVITPSSRWTLVYDTIYAHQDKTDDAQVGVHSTALGLGEESRAWLTLFSLGCVGSLAVAGAAAWSNAPPWQGPTACASSRQAWRPWVARHPQGERPGHWLPSHCLGC